MERSKENSACGCPAYRMRHPKVDASAFTFRDAAKVYCDAAGRDARRIALPLSILGDRLVTEIDQPLLDATIACRLSHVAPSTAVREFTTVVSAVIKCAAARGLCEDRSFKRAPLPRRKSLTWLRPLEADRITAACPEFFAPIFRLLLHTGAHAGECLTLDWRCVDLKEGFIRFRSTKSSGARTIPMHAFLREALERLPYREGAVCRRPDAKPYVENGNAGSSIKHAFKTACRRAGLPHIKVRDLRMTAAAYHFALYRDRDTLMYALGWRSEKQLGFLKLLTETELDTLRDELRSWSPAEQAATPTASASKRSATNVPRKRLALPDFRPWPAARLLTREEAAAYCGIGLESFLAVCSVPPLSMGKSKRLERYDIRRLDEWIDKLGNPGASSEEQSWIGLVEERHARRSRQGT